MFIVFGFTLDAEKLLLIIFALWNVAKVYCDIISGAEALHIELLSPRVKC
jgi:hypothetical protein